MAQRRKPLVFLADPGFWILDNLDFTGSAFLNIQLPVSSIEHLPSKSQRFIPEALQKLSVIPLSIGFDAAISTATLPLVHRDSLDRIIIAEALNENVSVLTKDRRFAEYGARALW